MDLTEFSQKESVVIVYTGEGKGKTSAALGLMGRALGNQFKVAFIQFIKYWGVSEHIFIRNLQEIYSQELYFYKGGKGFYQAQGLSDPKISPKQHLKAARDTYTKALELAKSGLYDLVICDEINNAVHDGLLSITDLENLIKLKNPKTSLCLTGRDFPQELIKRTDIVTNMTKIKHHFDDHFLANKGIDF
jgi:cob(I)alamin adenosyltransferase